MLKFYSRYNFISGKNCTDPIQLGQFLHQGHNNRQDTSTTRLKSNILSLGLQYGQLTPSNGNCFFEAVCDQLKRVGQPPLSPQQLRQHVVNYIRANPVLEV